MLREMKKQMTRGFVTSYTYKSMQDKYLLAVGREEKQNQKTKNPKGKHVKCITKYQIN